jgi:alpha-beta hydrolase superfamily lysophospholipase
MSASAVPIHKRRPEPLRFQMDSTDGLLIECQKCVGRHVRGVVQVAHGLGEHVGRFVSPRAHPQS